MFRHVRQQRQTGQYCLLALLNFSCMYCSKSNFEVSILNETSVHDVGGIERKKATRRTLSMQLHTELLSIQKVWFSLFIYLRVSVKNRNSPTSHR